MSQETGILKDEQAIPTTRELLSARDKERARKFRSDFTVVYISAKGHRQWPSIAESTVNFIARCVGTARELFIRQLADLRMRQQQALAEEERAAKWGGARVAKKGQDEEEEEDKFQLRHWTAPLKWGKTTTGGPPLERLGPLMSITPVPTIDVSGGEADPRRLWALWPEYEPLGSHSRKAEPSEWEDKWVCSNKRPHDLWITQGVGEGLPILAPMDVDPRADRFLLDQLVDTGSCTVEGTAAVNGEMLRRLRCQIPRRANSLHSKRRI